MLAGGEAGEMKPYPWHTVAPADFARSFKWAKAWLNPLDAAIRKHLDERNETRHVALTKSEHDARAHPEQTS